MEAKSRMPEVAVAPAASGGSVDLQAKAAGKEPSSPGTPSSADAGHRSGSGSKEMRRAAEDGVPLPGWKLDALCHESCTYPTMRIPYF